MKTTTALNKIAGLKKRIWIIKGGQGAGKTIAILMLLINHASSVGGQEIIIASDELTKMRLTVIKDFKKVIQDFGIFEKDRFIAGTLYNFKNGSFIKFIGLDKEDIGKGLRSDITFINECNKINFETYRELTSRAKRVIVDYNPNVEFWVDEHVRNRTDADSLTLTYKDNEYLSREEVDEIESYRSLAFFNLSLPKIDIETNVKSNYWANKWRVYGCGEYGQVEGAIFTDYEIGEFNDTLPFRRGLDFGFSSDPDALIKIAVDEKKKVIYMKEEMYKSGQSSDVLLTNLKNICGRNELIFADHSEQRLIADLSKHLNIKPCTKWTIIERIKKLQSYHFVVERNSTNLIMELISYIWSDKRSETPIDKNNHLIDALGYAFTAGAPAAQGVRRITF